jgi:hypothetical protein
MSSMLLTNPFVAPVLPPSLPNAVPLTAVTPAQNTTASQEQENATSFSGSGTGNSTQAETAALFKTFTESNPRPQNATWGSVITAQAVPELAEIKITNTMPEVKMPDPLPTSPFLKQSE